LAEKKISGCTVPSAAVGKAVADGFYVFADGFGHSAKELFPVVQGLRGEYSSLFSLPFFLLKFVCVWGG
jgi:hypothetical protein